MIVISLRAKNDHQIIDIVVAASLEVSWTALSQGLRVRILEKIGLLLRTKKVNWRVFLILAQINWLEATNQCTLYHRHKIKLADI